VIILENVCKSYRSDGRTIEVIRGLSFTFADGGVYVIEGPSGCGKSTLLGIMAGADRDRTGRVEAPPLISVSYQNSVLLPWLSCSSNVNLVLGGRRSTAGQAEALLAELGITEPGLMPSELSGGMKARAGLARALAYPADAYLLDEPFANLDPATAEMCAAAVLRHTAGKTVVAVIHEGTAPKNFAGTTLVCRGSPLSALIPK
jgi:ABC-type nitrate/sulfonate/bicarbonate transport system ATPase subunit